MQQLINRWCFNNKDVNIKMIRNDIDNEAFRNWVIETDKGEYANQKKIAAKPIETLFLKLGVYTLSNIENLVALNPNDSVRQMKKDLKNAILNIKNTAANSQDGTTALTFLKRQLARLKDIGGFSTIMPTEGLVFKYDGKLFKLDRKSVV